MLRRATAADLPAVLALNESEVPHVGQIPLAQLEWFLAHAAEFWVAESPTEPTLAGYIVALLPGAPYTSLNFLWFRERMESFLYVDRLAVDTTYRRRGLGRALYTAMAERARARRIPAVTCEVNLVPPNPESLAFHHRLGFVDVGTRGNEDGSYRVQLLRWDVPHQP